MTILRLLAMQFQKSLHINTMSTYRIIDVFVLWTGILFIFITVAAAASELGKRLTNVTSATAALLLPRLNV